MIKKKRDKKKEHHISFNIQDYDYLDTINEDGIRWELTRRNPEFIKLYSKIIRGDDPGDKNSLELYDKFHLSLPYEDKYGNKQILTPYLKYSCKNSSKAIPDNIKPLFPPDTYTVPVKVMTIKDMERAVLKNETLSNSIMDLFYHQDRKRAILEFIREILSPGNDQDTLYVGISMHHAKREEIISEIEKKLKALKIPTKNKKGDTKRRNDTFKLQILAYDLRKVYGYRFADIAETLYPGEENNHSNDYLVTKRVTGHFKAVDKMIRSIKVKK